MALYEMTVYPRTTTGKNANRRTRAAHRTPAVVYGNQRRNTTIELDTVELRRAIQQGGHNVLLAMTVEGTDDSFVAKLQDLQVHPVTDDVLHVDLLDIPLGVPLEVDVALNISGENRLVRGGDANLEVIRRAVTVRCLPKEVPASIDVDYTDLVMGDKIVVGQLSTPAGEIVTPADEMVLKLASSAFIAEEEPAEGEAVEEDQAEESAGEETKD